MSKQLTVSEILDNHTNKVLDYVGRMEKVGSPILFLGEYQAATKQSLKALVTEIVERIIGEIEMPYVGENPWEEEERTAQNRLRGEQRQRAKAEIERRFER